MATKKAQLNRLQIIINAVSDRTIHKVETMIETMRESGIDNETILERIGDLIETGPELAEVRSFATGTLPGFASDMAFRFGRDTLAEKQKELDDLQERYDEAKEAGETSAAKHIEERIRVANETLTAKGIESSAVLEMSLKPPPDADLSDEYLWVAVKDKNTCETCEGNHGEVKSLGDWAKIGEPRSGACDGGDRCRCVLIPVESMGGAELEAIRDAGPINLNDPDDEELADLGEEYDDEQNEDGTLIVIPDVELIDPETLAYLDSKTTKAEIAAKGEPQEIAIDQIRVVRKLRIAIEHVREIVAAKEDGERTKPIQLVSHKGRMILWNGHHRLMAAFLMGFRVVRAFVLAVE